MDQKINTKTGIIIILIISFTAGLFVWKSEKGKNIEEAKMQNFVTNKKINKNNQKENQEAITEQIVYDENTICPEGDIDEFGTISRDKDIILYETNCILSYDEHKRATTLYSYYARDINGTFNKKIFTVLNTPDFGGSTFARIVDPHLDRIVIHRTGENKEVSFVDVFGEKVDKFLYDEDDLSFEKQLSPNGKYLAMGVTQYWNVELRRSTNSNYVKVKNLENNTTEEYEIGRSNILSGWSSDSKKLYVSGGIYEFSAPAYLKEINVENGKTKEYKNLDNLYYPVNVFPEDNVAFVTDKNNWPGQEQQEKVNLYKIDLDNGKIKKIATESSQNTFRNIIKIGEDIFYESLTNDEKFVVKKMNIDSGKASTVFENSEVLAHSETDLVLKRDREYFIYDIDKNKEQLIGSGRKTVELMNIEFISEIVGFVYAK